MIVVDTNIIVYTFIEGHYTDLARTAYDIDSDWRLPTLWRHEFLNVLALYVQKKGMSLKDGLAIWGKSLAFFSAGEEDVNGAQVLRIAKEHKITAYDAQFIVLAQTLNVPCITEDRHLIKAFPKFALSLEKFCSI